jgi:hypothetical protein
MSLDEMGDRGEGIYGREGGREGRRDIYWLLWMALASRRYLPYGTALWGILSGLMVM